MSNNPIRLALNFSRCPGNWVPSEASYVDEKCSTCLRFIERHVPNTHAFVKAPIADSKECIFRKEAGCVTK